MNEKQVASVKFNEKKIASNYKNSGRRVSDIGPISSVCDNYPLFYTPTPALYKRICVELQGAPSHLRDPDSVGSQLDVDSILIGKTRKRSLSEMGFHERALYSNGLDTPVTPLPREHVKGLQSSSGAEAAAISPMLIDEESDASSGSSVNDNTQFTKLPSPSASPTSSFIPNHLFSAQVGAANERLQPRSSVLLSPAATSTHPSPVIQKKSMPTLDEIAGFISMFDVLPAQLKDYVMLQLLRRCPQNTLQFASHLIKPALKRDFLSLLPIELTHLIIGHLDIRTVVRLSRVSKNWRAICDSSSVDRSVWKQRLMDEGWYSVAEIKAAIDRHRQSLVEASKSLIVGELQRGLAAMASNMKRSTDSQQMLEKAQNSTQTANSATTEDSESAAPPHLYRDSFIQHYRTRRNWLSGRYKRISFAGHGSNVVTSLQFDSSKIISGSDDHTIHVYDVEQGTLRRILRGHEGGVWALHYVDHILVSGSTDRSVRVWDIDTGECNHVFTGHTSTVRCLVVLLPTPNPQTGKLEPEAPIFVTGSRDATLRVWRLPDPRQDPPQRVGAKENPYFLHLLQGHVNSVRAMAGAGHVLISGSYDSTVRIWNLENGSCRFVCRGHQEKVYSVGYCHETSLAASGSMDAKVKVWNVTTGDCMHTLEGHSSLVGLLEMSPRYLVSAAADSTLRIWCPTTGKCLASMVGHQSAITCFHHNAKLNRIVSGSDGGTRVWELSSLGYGKDGDKALFDTFNGRLNNVREPPESRDFVQYFNTTSSKGTDDQYHRNEKGERVLYGRFVRDLITDATGVWRVRMDERRLVAAVQKGQNETWFEVLDFGCPEEEIGKVVEREAVPSFATPLARAMNLEEHQYPHNSHPALSLSNEVS